MLYLEYLNIFIFDTVHFWEIRKRGELCIYSQRPRYNAIRKTILNMSIHPINPISKLLLSEVQRKGDLKITDLPYSSESQPGILISQYLHVTKPGTIRSHLKHKMPQSSNSGFGN